MTPTTMNDAIEIVVSHSPAVIRISKSLRHAFGRVAAEDIAARRGQPRRYRRMGSGHPA